jgi:hypothetical protein
VSRSNRAAVVLGDLQMPQPPSRRPYRVRLAFFLDVHMHGVEEQTDSRVINGLAQRYTLGRRVDEEGLPSI